MSEGCERCGGALPTRRSDCPTCALEGRKSGDPMLGRLFDGRYRILRRVGAGGMGQVHLARHVTLGTDVAVKSLRSDHTTDPILRNRFLREARIMNRLRHPNVVEVSDLGELEGGLLYLVMEYVEGTTLHAALREGPFDVGRMLRIAAQVGEALVAAHELGVVHRDLKPENVLLVGDPEDEHVKLLDFGIAALLEAPTITSPQQLLGTPGYMAPEYVRSGVADARSDLYSLGVCMYEMVSCRLPYEGRSYGALMLKQSTEPPTPLHDRAPDIDRRVEALVMGALEREPRHRPEDAATMLASIRALVDELGLALGYTAPHPSRPPSRGARTTDPEPITTAPHRPTQAVTVVVDREDASAPREKEPPDPDLGRPGIPPEDV